MGIPGGSDDKASACNVGDLGLSPGLGRSPEEGNGNSLQYSCLENSMDGVQKMKKTHWIYNAFFFKTKRHRQIRLMRGYFFPRESTECPLTLYSFN